MNWQAHKYRIWRDLGAGPTHEAASSDALSKSMPARPYIERFQSIDLPLCLPIAPWFQHGIANRADILPQRLRESRIPKMLH
jgi:hypothetical protein